MNRWRSMVRGALAAGALIGVFGLQPESSAQNHGHGGGMPAMGDHAPLVRTEAAKNEAVAREIELTGSVAAARIARLASPGEGPVSNCRWREGDLVEKGEVLVEIGRQKAAAADLASARQLLLEQEQELGRLETLVAAGAVPAAGLDAARSRHENARAQVARAVQNSEDYLVKAPWSGIVAKVLVEDGDYVAPRATLVEMFDPASLLIRFAVAEAQAMSLREAMGVRARLDAYPGRTWEGKISRVHPELEPRTRTRTVEAVLNGPVVLIPGMFARLTVILGTAEIAVTVPAAAVVTTPHGKAVFVVEEGRAKRRQVDTGIETRGSIQILSGIQAGEKVIIAGNERLKDGSPVRVAGQAHGDNMHPAAAGSGHQIGHHPDHQAGQPRGDNPHAGGQQAHLQAGTGGHGQ